MDRDPKVQRPVRVLENRSARVYTMMYFSVKLDCWLRLTTAVRLNLPHSNPFVSPHSAHTPLHPNKATNGLGIRPGWELQLGDNHVITSLNSVVICGYVKDKIMGDYSITRNVIF